MGLLYLLTCLYHDPKATDDILFPTGFRCIWANAAGHYDCTVNTTGIHKPIIPNDMAASDNGFVRNLLSFFLSFLTTFLHFQ